jgi:hypothetical protein
MNFMHKLRENWPQLTFLGVILLALVTTYIQVRVSAITMTQIKSDAVTFHINELIEAKLASAKIPTDGKIATMDGERLANKEAIGVERERLNEVGRILMKVPDG